MEQVKLCPKCKVEKPLSEYAKAKGRKDGHAGHCKKCHLAYSQTAEARSKLKAWRDSRKEHAKAYSAKYREKNKAEIKAKEAARNSCHEVKVARRKYKSSWWEANKESVCGRQRMWRQDNPEKVAKSSYKWAASNYVKVRAIKSRRAARIRGSAGDVRPEKIHEMLTLRSGTCNYCRVDITKVYTIDHIVPVSKGGRHEASNIQLLCRSCNSRKSNLDEDVFLRRARYEAPQRSHAL